ncbi:40S ribosomal protein S7-like [Andrographis paniculata]|uniref:40S ribosomal protein S7-like n=1 Tax=Andrographis paniculata TaxID=175694 RepID=UPI0021E777C7|nr:40S ribosomal protein S7-like [Andrographis paniculata]
MAGPLRDEHLVNFWSGSPSIRSGGCLVAGVGASSKSVACQAKVPALAFQHLVFLDQKYRLNRPKTVITRKILRPPKKGSAVQRPHTRTLTVVHLKLHRRTFSILLRLLTSSFLDPKAKNDIENQVETFSGVYMKLCEKMSSLNFP